LSSLLQGQEDPPVSKIELYPATAAKSAWTSYIFRESCRRTLLVLFMCFTLCNLLRNRLECSDRYFMGTRVTISAHLWKAATVLDFGVAWNEKKHFFVTNCDFGEVLESARVDDIDVFGRMVLTGMMGIDDVKGWFHTRGGTL
jgi:hypothetical protein